MIWIIVCFSLWEVYVESAYNAQLKTGAKSPITKLVMRAFSKIDVNPQKYCQFDSEQHGDREKLFSSLKTYLDDTD